MEKDDKKPSTNDVRPLPNKDNQPERPVERPRDKLSNPGKDQEKRNNAGDKKKE